MSLSFTKELLYTDFVSFMQNPDFNMPEAVIREDINPIDEAMNIDKIPDFEVYAALAK